MDFCVNGTTGQINHRLDRFLTEEEIKIAYDCEEGFLGYDEEDCFLYLNYLMSGGFLV